MTEVVYRLHREDVVAVNAVGQVLATVTLAAQAAHDALAAGGRLIYVGAGTSGRLGALDAAECPPTFGTDPQSVVAVIAGGTEALSRAVEGAEDDGPAGEEALRALSVSASDFVVGISASASNPFVRGALRVAKANGAKTALVTSNPGASTENVDLLIAPDTGPELVAGSTRLKAGTATKLILNAISTAAMVALGKVYRGRMVDLRPTNTKLRRRAEQMVSVLGGLSLESARELLQRADGNPRLALAMHFTGLEADEARARLASSAGLRALEQAK